MKFWNGSLCRNKPGPFPLLNVAAYWQSSNTEACAKKLSQILANNIDNGGKGTGLRIYVRYCEDKLMEILREVDPLSSNERPSEIWKDDIFTRIVQMKRDILMDTSNYGFLYMDV